MLAAALYRYGELPFSQCLGEVKRASRHGTRAACRGPAWESSQLHDVPLRELEHCSYTFDLIMDQGAYAEFKRHRMMSQTPQKLTTNLGYSIPRLMVEAGLRVELRGGHAGGASLYQTLSEYSPQVAQYIVPNGFHRRVLASFNLREAFAFCELRTAPNAHFSIRKIASGVAEEIRRVHPLLSKYMRLSDESSRAVQEKHFASP